MNYWVYIDGFNLYNGSLKNSPYKWLNLYEMSRNLRQDDDVGKVKYFTARVNARVNDPDQPLRQIAYWRALRSVPQIDIIEGHFLTKTTRMPDAVSVENLAFRSRLGYPVQGSSPRMFDVVKSEEKGTDVNLAVHLVHDAHQSRFDAALVISNDSDLTEAIRIVTKDLGKTAGVCTPCRSRDSAELQKTASYFFRLPAQALREAQFADIMTDAKGEYHKPPNW